MQEELRRISNEIFNIQADIERADILSEILVSEHEELQEFTNNITLTRPFILAKVIKDYTRSISDQLGDLQSLIQKLENNNKSMTS